MMYTDFVFNVVLVEPKIPQNTGTIARLCAANNTPLTLVGDLGFSLDDSYLKRAGLDYWDFVTWTHVPDMNAFFDGIDEDTTVCPCLFSSHATVNYTQPTYTPNHMLIFGSETQGLPASIRDRYPDQLFTIPMANPNIRSLNLANAVSIVLYEAIRQQSVLNP